jgi:hypothetical protein
MKVVHATDVSIESLTVAEVSNPQPRRGDLLIKVGAASLNYRVSRSLPPGTLPICRFPSLRSPMRAAP